ncbi:MAG: 4Fe-4S binding protein [Chloroflexi bacterium]|nr:4Fe-4S binding protein [Chloroflexota bacterium]
MSKGIQGPVSGVWFLKRQNSAIILPEDIFFISFMEITLKNKSPYKKFRLSALKTLLIIMGIFWLVAIVLWQATGANLYLFNFLYIGTSLGTGLATYSLLPKSKKHRGRKLSQLLIGIYMLSLLGLLSRQNMQIEGFSFYLLTGFFAGAVIHYLVAKVAGPRVFNRMWCSWACWTAMVLDYLPFPRNKSGRLPTRWGNLRYIHFALSLGLILVLWFAFGYRVRSTSMTELHWLVGGNALYYSIAIILAFRLKDNRAFCKYICPITAILKVISRFSLYKMAGDAEKYNDCGACEKTCPMDIRITDYIKNGQRVLSTECSLSYSCENVGLPKALKANWGFDCGTKELLNMRNGPVDKS